MIELFTVESPIGPLILAVRQGLPSTSGDPVQPPTTGRVCALYFGATESAVRSALGRWYPSEPPGSIREGSAEARRCGPAAALRAYFDGDVHALEGLDVELNGTPFQLRVWNALRRVPVGRTASYSDVARDIGAPAAVRAVGAANGANPVAIVIPCHRIVGTNGSLTGYGGGLDRKRWLLAHERWGAGLAAATGARRSFV